MDSGVDTGVSLGIFGKFGSTGVTPSILNVSAVSGNDYVTFNYNTGIQLSGGGDYTDGFTILVNNNAVVLSYIEAQSSPNNGKIDFRLTQTPEALLAANDLISFSYTKASGSIVSILGNISPEDQSDTYSLPASGLYVRTIDFELGVAGQPASADSTPYGFDGHSSSTTSKFSDSFTELASVMALKTTLLEGTFGTTPNVFGGRWEHLIPPGLGNLGEGEEMWFRISLYYPKAGEEGAPSLNGVPTGQDFQFNTVYTGFKTLRVHNLDSYHDLYTRIGGLSHEIKRENSGFRLGGPKADFYQVNRENAIGGLNLSGFNVDNTGSPPTIGAWMTYEVNIKLTTEFGPPHGTGSPHWRIWQDGVLIWEDMVVYTMNSSISVQDFVTYSTYWNGGQSNPPTAIPALQTQSVWIDNVRIQTAVPSNVDAAGNPMIGPIGWVNP